MATITVDTLRTTISNSQVLTPGEKQEWLRLVEFMNDKQLLDLYKILVPGGSGSQQGVPVAPVAPSAAPAPQPSTPPPPAQTFPIAPVMPAPSVGQAPTPSPVPVGGVGEGASLSSFLHRTAVAPSPAPVPVSPKPQSVPPVQPVATPPPAQTVPPPSPPTPVQPTTPFPMPQAMPAPQAVPAPAPVPVPSVSLVPAAQVSSVAVPADSPAVQPQPAPATGTQLPAWSYTESSEVQTTISSLEDVTKVGVRMYRNLGGEKIFEKMRTLAKHKGYFDVLFAFEKSPLYAAYVHTGMQLIQQNLGFEQLSEKQDLGVYLSREEFEDMTDMLRTLGVS